jgi:hypothetical protein
VQSLDQGDGESGGLAGAGLGTAQQVAAFQQVRNALGLDGRGRGVAFGLKGLKDGLDQSEPVKGGIVHAANKGSGHPVH